MSIPTIVVANDSEALIELLSRDALADDIGATLREQFGDDDVEFDYSYRPVRLPRAQAKRAQEDDDEDDDLDERWGNDFAIRASFRHGDALLRFLARNETRISGIYVDPELHLMPMVGEVASGDPPDSGDVLKALRVSKLHRKGGLGQDVRIAVVDSGVSRGAGVVGGFSLVEGRPAGQASAGHGTMVSFDARIAAPNAGILDFVLFESEQFEIGVLSTQAVWIYDELIRIKKEIRKPLVVVNSWGLVDRSTERIVNAVRGLREYSNNPNHPLNRVVGAAVDKGMDVIFAAGNCGTPRPDSVCGATDRGPGSSIHGANAHPKVITVGAVNIKGARLKYSSQGRGTLSPKKPDIMGFGRFLGSQVFGETILDNGTSVACPVVAGVVAALRSTPEGRSLSPSRMKDLLLKAARRTGAAEWNREMGWGVIDGDATLDALLMELR